MDPVTGFSRRSLLGLGLVVALGVVASTVATVVETSAAIACPDREYGCARFEPGEPLQIAVIVSEAGDPGVSTVVPATVRGRPVRVLPFRVGCSVVEAARAAREIATDPPDGPPFLGAIVATCPRAALPVAQILDDSGISLLVRGDPPSPPAPVGFSLLGLEPVAAAEALIEVVERVAVEHEGSLLVPRTGLRDGLVAEGLPPLPAAGPAASAAGMNRPPPGQGGPGDPA